jgi:ATP/maltotriose-dependent transcriptional regulator MalT
MLVYRKKMKDIFKNINFTKITIPQRRADLYSRARLNNLLSDLLQYQLVILIAPVGYGKTSLLIDVAHQTSIPFCWYSVDSHHQNLHHFIAHVIAAIGKVFLEFGQQSLKLLYETKNRIDIEQMIKCLADEIDKHIAEEFVFIFDDFHLVETNDQVSHFVNQMIQHIGPKCHIVIASHNLVALDNLPFLIAQAKVKGIDFEEIAFQADELQAFVQQNYPTTIPRAEVEALAKSMEGWAMGLVLVTFNSKPGYIISRLRKAQTTGRGLYYQLAELFLEQLPAEIQEFLLYTSPFEAVSVERCQKVWANIEYPGDPDWAKYITMALEKVPFITAIKYNRHFWLSYHYIFRQFLYFRFTQQYPDAEQPILERLAYIYTEEGLWDEAYDLYHRLNDVRGIIHLIEQGGVTLIQQGRRLTLAGWIKALPTYIVEATPSLRLLLNLINHTSVGANGVYSSTNN